MLLKYTFLGLSICLLFGCKQASWESKPETALSQDTVNLPMPRNVEEDTTVYPNKDFMPNMLAYALPPGCRIDSLVNHDKARNAKFRRHFVVTGNARLDKEVRKIILATQKLYVDSLESWSKKDTNLRTYSGSYFDMKYLSVSKGGPVTSVLLLEKGFVAGWMMHSYYDYVVINYNRQTNAFIEFKDVLRINSSQDSAEFIQLINENLNYPGAEIYSVGNEEIIFNEEEIIICYRPYAAHAFAYGGFQVRMPKTKLSKWLNPAYQ